MKKNMKKLITAGVLVPAIVLSLAACGSSGNTAAQTAGEDSAAAETAAADTAAAEQGTEETGEKTAAVDKVYENKGMKLTVTADMADKITVETPEISEDGVLFDVYETKSVEAGKALGEENLSVGWLFAICERDAESVHKIMYEGYGAEDILAVNGEGTYYVYYHPTDVRYERETPEQMQADQDEWTEACEWADSVKTSFLSENSGLTPVSFGGTVPEQWLARAAYDKSAKYTLSTTEFGPLEPGNVNAEPYFERLTNGAKFEYAEGEAPDGEYVVLNFPELDTRLDFFLSEEGGNVIRIVWNGEQNEELFKVTYADGKTVASQIMQEWYHEIAENR